MRETELGVLAWFRRRAETAASRRTRTGAVQCVLLAQGSGVMAYIKPPWFVQKVFNPLAMMLGMSGVATLAIKGRTSGAVRKVPVIPIEVNGAKYIVSTRGESEWVRNLRA